MDIQLRKHQLRAVNLLESGSVLLGGVGSGKSRTAIAYYYIRECNGGLKINGQGETSPMTSPMDLYIITTARKRDSLDWEDECAKFGLFKDPENNKNNVKVTVDSWNNISKYKDVSRAFFIFDEQRLVGGGAWVKSFLSITRNQNLWILLTATPGDTWLDYIPLFVANGYYRNKSDFTRQHVVFNHYSKFPKVDRYIETHKLERIRKELTVEMPFEKHTVRNNLTIPVGYDAELFNRVVKDRWHVYENRPIRDISELISVARKVVNSDSDRLVKIRDLLKKHPRLIVFYNFNYELDILRTLGEDYPIAEWNGHKHEKIPEGDKWVYLVQYAAGAEAWNCISSNATAFYSLNYSYRAMEQAKGRIDRMDTPFVNLYYYTLRSMSAIDAAIMKALRAKRNFNEKEFKTS